MKEAVLEVYLENLRLYADGKESGRWVSLPQKKEELEEKIREISGENQDEVMISDISVRKDCVYMAGFVEEWSSMEELNAVSWLVGKIPHPAVQEAVQAYQAEGKKPSLTELANLLLQEKEIPFRAYKFDGSDNPKIMGQLSNEKKMGYTVLENNRELKELLEAQPFGGSDLISYIDMESAGRDLSLSGEYYLGETGYFDRSEKELDLSRYTMEEIRQEAAEREIQDGAPIILTVTTNDEFQIWEEPATERIVLPLKEEELQKRIRDIEGPEWWKKLVVMDCSFRSDCKYMKKFLPKFMSRRFLPENGKIEILNSKLNNIEDWNMLAKLIGNVPHPGIESYLEDEVEDEYYPLKKRYYPLELSNLLLQEEEIQHLSINENNLYTNWYSREEIRQELYVRNLGEKNLEKMTEEIKNVPFVLSLDKENVDKYPEKESAALMQYGNVSQDTGVVTISNVRADYQYLFNVLEIGLYSTSQWRVKDLTNVEDLNMLAGLIGDEFHPAVKAYARVYLTEGEQLTPQEMANLFMQEKELPYIPGQRPNLHEYSPNLSKYTMEEIKQEVADREQRGQKREKQEKMPIILTVAKYNDLILNKEKLSTKQILLPQKEEVLREQLEDIAGLEWQKELVITDCSFRSDSRYLKTSLPKFPSCLFSNDGTVKIDPKYNNIEDWNMLAELIGDSSHPVLKSYLEEEGRVLGCELLYNPLELSNLLLQEKEARHFNIDGNGLYHGREFFREVARQLYPDWYSRKEIRQELYGQNLEQREPWERIDPFVLYLHQSEAEDEDEYESEWFPDEATGMEVGMPLPDGTLQGTINDFVGRRNKDLTGAHVYKMRDDCQYIFYLVESSLVSSHSEREEFDLGILEPLKRSVESLENLNTLAGVIGDDFHPAAKAYARVYLTEGRRLTVPEFANLLMQEKELPYTPGQRPDLHEYTPNLSRYTMEEIQQELADREQRRQEPEQKAVQDPKKKEDRAPKEKKAEKEQQHIPVSPSL